MAKTLALPQSETGLPENAFAELRRQINSAGLLDKQPLYYTLKIALTLSMMALSFGVFLVLDNFWILLAINAPFMAFVFGQIGFISHDSGHRQIFTKAVGNEIVAMVCSFGLGLSRTWWIEKHNKHHRNPNQLGMDPDIEILVLAFSEEQALAKPGFVRAIVKWQAYLFLPVLFLQGFALRVASVQHMLKNRPRYLILEPLSVVAQPIVYLIVLSLLLNPWQAVVFFVVNQALFGLYMASVFAPNHKGMLVLDRDTNLGFLERQVLTARDVKGHPFVDFWYGGLNYQVEHHLFPNMPRNNLRKAQGFVKEFCAEHGITYHEVGMLQSFQEIIKFLHDVSAPLRQKALKGEAV